MRYTQIPFIFVLLILTAGCEHALREENKSLREELVKKEEAVLAMKEIKMIIDSIDAERRILRIELKEGLPHKVYAERLQDILHYVRAAEKKLDMLNRLITRKDDTNSGYALMVSALQDELTIASAETESLQKHVEVVEGKHEQMITLAQLQQEELDENLRKLELSREELQLFENRIHQLMVQSRVSEADAYFARAEAVYEAARRTHLAPRKKRDTLREALELYKKSLSLGKSEAITRIEELNKKI